MSCTVFAVPFALYWVVGTFVTSVATSSALNNVSQKNQTKKIDGFVCNDVDYITEDHFIEKDFETPFMDKEILIKTLNEHGVRDLEESENIIKCNIDGYKLTFTKNEIEKPYLLRISAVINADIENKMDNLNSEYAMNVQEDAYLHILEKLKENNMSIENEEVQEDNTIVLTINIDN